MRNIKEQRIRLPAGTRLLVGSGAIALATLGGTFFFWNTLSDSTDPISIRLVNVERHTIEVSINESGIIEFADQQTLTSPAEGAVERVFVSPGDRVTVGQTLITLRNPQRQTALALQEVLIEQQNVVLERNRQRVVEAQEQLDAEEDELSNLENLLEQGAIARTDVLEQENAMRQRLATLRDAELEVKTAESSLTELRLEQQRIEQELKDTVISAPIDGLILGVSVKDGDGVEIRTDLLTIGDSSQEFVELELSTLNASNVKPGQQTRISVIGPDPQYFMGTIVGLYPQAVISSQDTSTGNSSDAGQPRVPTVVQLNQPSNTLIPGGTVNAEIILEQRQNVIALSIEAIQQIEIQPFVWMIDNTGKAKQQFVETGLEGLTRIEIIDGLTVGDQVVLPPLDAPLSIGTPVVEGAPIDATIDDIEEQ